MEPLMPLNNLYFLVVYVGSEVRLSLSTELMFTVQDWMKLNCLTSAHQVVSACLSKSLSLSLSFFVPIRNLRIVQLHSFCRNENVHLTLSIAHASRNLKISSTLLQGTIFLNTWQNDLLSSPACESLLVFWISCLLNCRSAFTTDHSWDWKQEFQTCMWKVMLYA